MNNTAIVPIDPRLIQHADKIRYLMSNVALNGIALGNELRKAHKHFKSLPKNHRPARTWSIWLYEQFKMSDSWARYLITAAAAMTGGSANIRRHAPEVIVMLTSRSAKAVPPGAKAEIEELMRKGHKVSRRKAKAIVRFTIGLTRIGRVRFSRMIRKKLNLRRISVGSGTAIFAL